MSRSLAGSTVFAALVLAATGARAQTAVLLAADEPTQIGEVELAKVMADDSSLWFSVRLKGPTRLAVVTAQAGIEQAPAAEAWLRALDFATRMRVAPPLGPTVGCTPSDEKRLADSGLPEPVSIPPFQVSSPNSELELRRTLEVAGVSVDLARLSRFTQDAKAPFLVSLYQVQASGGSTPAVRLFEQGHATELPRIAVSGLDSVPVSLIALARGGVQPALQDAADPSEFAVTYRASNATTDYTSARAAWLSQNPARWLGEVEASPAVFAWTVFPSNGQIAPVVTRYFQNSYGAPAGSCEARVQAAFSRGSLELSDFVCDGADDLAHSLSELGFQEPRLSRFFGSLPADGAAFQLAPGTPRRPFVLATDFDTQDCAPLAVGSPVTPGAGMPLPGGTPPVVVSEPSDPSYVPSPESSAYQSDGSCNVAVFDAGPNDSCGGTSTPTDSATNDSCSGNSSSSDGTTSDSCSGDSSSTDKPSSDNCSGDSGSGSDSSGCGKSGYNGDTCSGSPPDGASSKVSAALEAGNSAGRRRPRPVRMSLLTLLAAALALPLRRLRASR